MLGEASWTSTNRHTAALAPAVQNMMSSLGVEEKKLKAIAIALGPGSFTSLRVGLSFVKGMSLGLGIPVIGVPTLDIIASQQPVSEMPLYAFLQAGRGKLAASLYTAQRGRWSSDNKIEVFSLETLCERVTENTILCGEFDAEMRTNFHRLNKNLKLSSPAMSLRRTGFLAELAWKIFEKGDYPSVASLSPIYLHTHDPIPG